jgi:hypothetical protein
MGKLGWGECGGGGGGGRKVSRAIPDCTDQISHLLNLRNLRPFSSVFCLPPLENSRGHHAQHGRSMGFFHTPPSAFRLPYPPLL